VSTIKINSETLTTTAVFIILECGKLLLLADV